MKVAGRARKWPSAKRAERQRRRAESQPPPARGRVASASTRTIRTCGVRLRDMENFLNLHFDRWKKPARGPGREIKKSVVGGLGVGSARNGAKFAARSVPSRARHLLAKSPRRSCPNLLSPRQRFLTLNQADRCARRPRPRRAPRGERPRRRAPSRILCCGPPPGGPDGRPRRSPRAAHAAKRLRSRRTQSGASATDCVRRAPRRGPRGRAGVASLR
jgi:hypothetical protein